MKKSLLALAVLGAFAGAASAQSSVTIYGFVDLALAKQIGTEDQQVWDSPDSRIGFRGSEDLGGGLKAIFQFEHRFNAATGDNSQEVDTDNGGTMRIWHAISMVGLSGNFGTFGLGRQYNGAWPVQNGIDPWGDDSVAGLRSVGVNGDLDGLSFATDKRLNNSIRYDSPNIAGFTFAATYAEANDAAADNPWAVSGVYSAGPLWIGIGYESPANGDDLTTIGGKYKFGTFGINAGYSFGTGSNNDYDADIDSWILAGTAQLGGGELRVGYAEYQEDAPGVPKLKLKKASLGYYYSLSKRTRVYADVAKGSSSYAVINGGDEDEDFGYGVGIRHSF